MKYKLSAKIGDTKDGKAIWGEVGVLIEENGKRYILLNRTFNPAGVPNPDNSSSVIVGIYEDKPKDSQHNQAKGNGYQPDDDSEIPF